MAAADYYTQVYTMFVGYFGRPPTQSGLDYYAGLVDKAGGSVSVVIDDFFKSTESQAFFSGKSVEQQINQIFQNLFGRDAAPAGLNYWAAQIQGGTVALAQAAYTIATNAAAADIAVLNAKIATAKLWVAGLDTTTEILTYSTDAGRTAGREFLKTVTTSTTATQTSVDTALKAMVDGNSSNPGQNYTLTTGVDNITGSVGNDTITADNTGTNKQLTAADQINGGSGTDTLKIYLATGDTATGQPTLTSIENVYINGGAITAYTAATGTTSLSIDSQVVDTAATFTLAGQSLTLANHTVANNTTTTVASSSDTTQSITLNAIKAASGKVHTLDLSGTKVTSATLTGTGAASTITLTNTGAALTTLNIAGDKSITLTESIDALKTINGSAATAAVSVNATGATLNSAFAFTGGSANDTLTLKAGALALLTAGSQLDGGAGTGDALALSETAVLTAAQVAKVNAAKNFEVLSFAASGSGVDVSTLTSINQFKVASGNLSETFTNANSSSKFTIDNSASNTGTVIISNKVGDTATSVTLDTGSATSAKTLATLTLTGITNVSLVSSGASGNIITTLNNADNSAITVTGSADLTLATIATSIGSKVDGSAATGKLTLTGNTTAFSAGSSLGDILIGGSAADTLKAAINGGTLTGNAGSDTFDVSVALGGTTFLTTITDFTKGDILKFANKGTETFTTTKVDVSAASTLAAALDLASTGDGSTNGIVKWFQFGGNTYIVEDVTAGATFAVTDIAVKLTGTLDLSSSTIDATANTLTFA